MNMSVFKSVFIKSALIAICFVCAGCNLEKNWQEEKAYVTIGGTVTGLTSGTLQLVNNGKGRTSITSNGSFEIALLIANGSDYAVSVAVQPDGLNCKVANGNGTATADVTSVAVTCTPYSFTRRNLPTVYTDVDTKAINYSPYRTNDGPRVLEVPTDAQILEDLRLLDEAGYNLLRLFGAEPPATDVVSEKILQLANENYPHIKFQLGVFLGGLTSCNDSKNDENIAYLITKLSTYPNVVTISVGNETSFYSKYMPVACLASYIRTIRAQVEQPVTADDDYTFYAGLSSPGEARAGYKPSTILPLLDFAAIHLYPFSNSSWDWQQISTSAGSERAKKTMETSLYVAKDWFNLVATYSFNDNGQTKTVAQAMPIVIGETGWKARKTGNSSLETYLAKQVNAKWYTDLLYGNTVEGYPSWEGSFNGPTTIFYFEAFDETWKGTDDGWGLWDINRDPRYALCGLMSSVVCNADLYQAAGFYNEVSLTTAPTTVIPSGSVVVYSDASATAGFSANPNWGQATIYGGELTIASNKVLKYSNLNYQGLDWYNNPINVSLKTKLHIDFWTSNLTSIKVFLISQGPVENEYTQELIMGEWGGVDIPLTTFIADKTAIRQIKLEASGGGTIYVDNIYFY